MVKLKRELIDFFKYKEGWDKQEILEEYIHEILTEAKSEFTCADLLSINDDEKEIMMLDEFSDKLFDKIIDGVCNVIETAENDCEE